MNNILNRPLFRQAGGPAAMMPQDMMAPPQMAPNNPEEQLMQVEQTAEAEGRAYVENVMGGIDAAEDVTSMINALRGNEAPLESRYAELAGFVGEADAGKTPESVLALVQPTLMMTQEGAIDSGIGELMSGMAESEMETPQGAPTPMGQGVGELMTMGAGSTPPVNFRQGGEVQYFAPGGSVISNAQKMAPEYQKYFAGAMDSEARAADLEEQKKLSQAQILFDIAQTALAAGAPTATPMSAAERIAGAVGQTQLFDKMGQRSAGLLQAKQAQAAEDRQMRMAGLTASLTQSQADDTFRKNLELASAKKSAGTPKFETLYDVNEAGNLTGQGTRYDLTDPLSLTAYNTALATGNYRDATTAAPFLEALGEAIKPQELTQVQVTAPITVDGYTYKTGEIANLTPRQTQDNARKWSVVPEEAKFVTLNNGSETKLVITNAPGSIKTLTDLGKLGWSESTLEAETAAKKDIIAYTQGFDKEAQGRLFANQKELAGMSDTTTRRGQDLQREIAKDANALKLTLQGNEQLFTTGRDQTLQGYKTALQSYGATIAEQLQNLKGQQGVEIESLRADLRDQSSRVTSELQLANQLEVAKVKNVYEISQLTTASERNTELVKLRAVLGDTSRKDQNVFVAGQALLGRVAAAENNVLNINARSALQKESQRFTLTENEKNRVESATESALARVAAQKLQVGSQAHSIALQDALLEVRQSEGLNAREASALEGTLNRASKETLQTSAQEFKAIEAKFLRDFQGTEAEKKALAALTQNMSSNALEGERLDLQAARDIISANASSAKTTLDRERFELEKAEEPLLAARGTDATIKALSDQDKLDRYGNNTMPATEANQFDMIIEYWAKKQTETWSSAANNGQGGYIASELKLGPALKKAIADRVAILGQEKVPDLSIASNFVVTGAPGSVAAYAFNEDGTVNPDSFNSDNTLIISGVDLSKSQGIASGFNRLFKNIGSFVKEITLGTVDLEGGPDTKVGVTRRADAELDALARKTITLGRSGVEGKVFALDIKLLEKEVENFKSSSFGTDYGALDQLYVTRASLASEFKNIVQVLNNPSGFKPLQVTTARAALPQMEELLGEYTAAILIYERALNSSSSDEANTASDEVQESIPMKPPGGGSLTGNAPRVK